jgi:hypothetical protein
VSFKTKAVTITSIIGKAIGWGGILALGEPELAPERFKLNANSQPDDVMAVIWDPQLDQIRCDQTSQQVLTQLKVSDRRAKRVRRT